MKIQVIVHCIQTISKHCFLKCIINEVARDHRLTC